MNKKTERLFQDCKGKVERIEGLTLSGMKCLYEVKNNNLADNVVLFWLKTKNEDCWIRIFIDGVYCGIDKYLYDESKQDEDDWVAFKNYDSLVNDLTINYANVASKIDDTKKSIELEISLSNYTQIVLASNEDEKCTLIFKK